ncbi:MAG: low molecular weight phosphatase family protein [Jatrophihabitans sp.]|uniref:arsenate reductase/protein-tyrosine-phosphatase family protein n=1 Tax=Jatrophihabitans sp. TaxID=1932789 RepID=UPI003F7DE233
MPVLLFVCTGNICRSPAAEAMLRAWTAPGADLVVTSAGTAAVIGAPVDAPTARRLTRLGVDASGHRARALTPAMIGGADLVLTAEVRHRDLAMTAAPAAFRRMFTMKEFVRLAAHARATGTLAPGDAVDLAALTAALADARAAAGSVPPGADDIADPFRRGRAAAARAVDEIADCVRATITALGLPPAADLPTVP